MELPGVSLPWWDWHIVISFSEPAGSWAAVLKAHSVLLPAPCHPASSHVRHTFIFSPCSAPGSASWAKSLLSMQDMDVPDSDLHRIFLFQPVTTAWLKSQPLLLMASLSSLCHIYLTVHPSLFIPLAKLFVWSPIAQQHSHQSTWSKHFQARSFTSHMNQIIFCLI